jgi:uncharacterized protein YceH (UPF0502 family)
MTDFPRMDPAGTGNDVATLTSTQSRVLGCLIEKAATTPDVYPLTLNALHLACNQKSSREPVMNLELGEVGHALHTLQEKKFARVEHGARALRYAHTADAALNLTQRSLAVIGLLLLRGPQTLGELYTRSERLADFPDVESVGDTVERLIARDAPLVVRIGRGAGQREDRYMHLLCGPVSAESVTRASREVEREPSRVEALESRIEALENEVAELRRLLEARGS